MKKVLFSLASAALLFSSCGSDENVQTVTKTGELNAQIKFDGISPKAAALSTAIPITSWSNVKKIQLFLYNSTTGNVVYSDIIDPSTSSTKVFTWTNVPEGTYDVALVANINNNPDNVYTSLDGGLSPVAFTPFNVKNKKLNTDIYIDLKESAFPSGHNFGPGKVPYAPASEIFTAYASGIVVTEGQTTSLTGVDALQLKREISLMRLRVDRSNKPESAPNLSDVDFAHTDNFVSVSKLPVGFDLKLGSFEGGINDTPSDANRVMIGSKGITTFNDADPATGYNPNVILGGNYTLWQDIRVLPNATRADGIATSADADPSRRYVLVIAGWVPAGYEYADGTLATVAQPVYWSGTIKGVFSPNVIREVNMNIKSRGYSEIPEPQPEGELIIEVGDPEDWNTQIEREDIEG
ncbi:FimB/Mfa2 family fimbrial subunit [Dysgonomonas sp. Marseille-P4677]|uniref:FimB/Mfa2 family fimbrial subunit n=1 Tax=Dysgonomonas sp. Marseille-P4677 TaxID=2364790 RepID=UPI001911C8BC|nr:FimB/Mfa2 family fimbrial subunit [Dysgonomonas sp. Marseille-P4677]MBK5719714.1 FimB/Mfa2 family fimbrial subunit [Dysgonomonas sp. Marseille-P4677]